MSVMTHKINTAQQVYQQLGVQFLNKEIPTKEEEIVALTSTKSINLIMVDLIALINMLSFLNLL